MLYLQNILKNNTLIWLLNISKTGSILFLTTTFLSLKIKAVEAQSVIGAEDGVGTIVEQEQNTININGGTQAGNNLFHSFEKFGLSESQTAIFFSNPEIVNILGRVVGDEASIINGLIQVNSDANLFLMNPGGIIFGENGSLNVSGDFFATTATGIGFGEGDFFNAYGDNDFSALTENPFQFAFDGSDSDDTPRAIVNAGNLAIDKDINLVAGSVISTGTISSSQGNITISTVPNSSLVSIEQEGNLVSLEIEPPRDVNGEIIPFSAEDLPELLTGNILVNEVGGENVTIQAHDGDVLVGTEDTFESSSFLPEIAPFDGSISANDRVNLTGTEVFITDNSTLMGENVIVQPDNGEQNQSNNEQNLQVQVFNEDGETGDQIEGIDLDGDGVPDVPTGIVRDEPPVETVIEPSEEESETVRREGETPADNETLSALENETSVSQLVFQPENQRSPKTVSQTIQTLDKSFSRDYLDYYALNEPTDPANQGSGNNNGGKNLPNPDFWNSEDELEISLAQIKQVLKKIEEATGAKPAVIYGAFYPSQISSKRSQPSILPQDDDELELIVVTAEGEPVRRRVKGADRIEVEQTANRFANSVSYELPEEEYLPPSQQLYQWLVEPLAKDLETKEIDNLVFILESGIRSIPFAALHDGEKYLVEKYSVGMMPSFRLTNTIYQDIRDLELLAMGADTFNDQELDPLPAVPTELDIVSQNLWTGKSFLNQDFTIDNLKQTQSSSPFGILHLATHAEFKPGEPSNSFVQFGDRKLRLNEVRELGLNNPLVELIVLSACNTAVGDKDAEYGFASLAYQAGVKSALGSLWYVSDSGTLALMSKFYSELKDSPIKAEALRRAQVAMIKEKVRLKDGKLIGEDFEFDLPAGISAEELTHPSYWSPFTIIGNPW